MKTKNGEEKKTKKKMNLEQAIEFLEGVEGEQEEHPYPFLPAKDTVKENAQEVIVLLKDMDCEITKLKNKRGIKK